MKERAKKGYRKIPTILNQEVESLHIKYTRLARVDVGIIVVVVVMAEKSLSAEFREFLTG